jgi:hypothetical protein
MSLVPFHRLLIATAIVFCVGFALWELAAFVDHGRIVDLALAIGFAAAGAAFGYYLRHLARLLGLSSPDEARGGERVD